MDMEMGGHHCRWRGGGGGGTRKGGWMPGGGLGRDS